MQGKLYALCKIENFKRISPIIENGIQFMWLFIIIKLFQKKNIYYIFNTRDDYRLLTDPLNRITH